MINIEPNIFSEEVKKKLALPYVKLDAGCGLNFYEREDTDWIRMDGSSADGIDVVGNFKKMPFADNSIDLVHSSDTVEHFPQFELDIIMGEFNRIMKIGSKFIGTTPNLFFCLKAAHEKTHDFTWLIRNLYGDRNSYLDQHYILYTKDTLTEMFKKYGFDIDFNTAWGDDDNNWAWLSFTAVKTRNI